jgi:hypothetical protein
MTGRHELLAAKIAETRLSIDQHLCRLHDLIDAGEWDLASYVAADNLKESLLLMRLRTKQLAKLEDK